MNRRQACVLAAVASCATTLLVGGITWAAIPGDGGMISACYGKVGGVVRVIDIAKREKCIPGVELPLSWNQQGPEGIPGAPGASPTVAQLEPNDANCPAGGAAITDPAGHTAYVCSAQPFSGIVTSPSGEYAISVTDAGITLSRGNTAAVSITGQDIAIVAERDTTITVGRNLATTTGGALDTTVDGSATITVGASLSTSVGAASLTTVGANADTMVGGSQTTAVGGAVSETVGTDRTVNVGHDTLIHTAGDLDVTTDGDTQIVTAGTGRLQSAGTLTIRGSQVNIN